MYVYIYIHSYLHRWVLILNAAGYPFCIPCCYAEHDDNDVNCNDDHGNNTDDGNGCGDNSYEWGICGGGMTTRETTMMLVTRGWWRWWRWWRRYDDDDDDGDDDDDDDDDYGDGWTMTTMGEERWMVMMPVINDAAAVDNDDSDGHSRWVKDVGWLDGGLAVWL